jgi:hypothetical protein
MAVQRTDIVDHLRGHEEGLDVGDLLQELAQ